LKITNDF